MVSPSIGPAYRTTRTAEIKVTLKPIGFRGWGLKKSRSSTGENGDPQYSSEPVRIAPPCCQTAPVLLLILVLNLVLRFDRVGDRGCYLFLPGIN